MSHVLLYSTAFLHYQFLDCLMFIFCFVFVSCVFFVDLFLLMSHVLCALFYRFCCFPLLYICVIFFYIFFIHCQNPSSVPYFVSLMLG